MSLTQDALKPAAKLKPRAKRSAMARQEAIWGYVMIAPMLLGFGIFFYLAVGVSFLIGLTEWDVLTAPKFVGVQNYINLFNDKIFWKMLWNTSRYALMAVPMGQIVSLILAVALNTRIRLRNIYRLLFFLPVLTLPVAIAIVWRFIYNPEFGILNQVLGLIGIAKIKWLSDPNWSMISLVIVSIWSSSGYGMLLYLAGLQNIPREYYEAAQVDGASNLRQFMNITIPLLTPTIFFNVVTSVINSFQVFDIVFTMTKGGPSNTTRTIVYDIYENGFQFFRMGYATATSWILLAIILVLTLIQLRAQKKWVHYQ
jgi:multiple sugar transport system permease protein